MGAKIKIEPNDQSWVGQKVTLSSDWKEFGEEDSQPAVFEILSVGNGHMFVRDTKFPLIEMAIQISLDWELYKEPKEPVLVAPALLGCEGSWEVTDELFDSLKAAKDAFANLDEIIWPAIRNADGYYELPEGVEQEQDDC